MTENLEPRRKRILGFEIARAPRSHLQGNYFHIRITTFVGLMLVLAHEIIYRQFGGKEYELNGLLSHAGADMLLFTVFPMVFVLILIESGRKK